MNQLNGKASQQFKEMQQKMVGFQAEALKAQEERNLAKNYAEKLMADIRKMQEDMRGIQINFDRQSQAIQAELNVRKITTNIGNKFIIVRKSERIESRLSRISIWPSKWLINWVGNWPTRKMQCAKPTNFEPFMRPNSRTFKMNSMYTFFLLINTKNSKFIL